MKVAFANDHRGAAMRQALIARIRAMGHEVIDYGVDKEESVDYPDYAAKGAGAVSKGEADRAVLICGTGIGMSIAANKLPGVRAAVCTDELGAELARRHNDANVLALRGCNQDLAVNLRILETFLSTEFDGGRHQRRVEKIAKLEE
ncbi:MAG: ribose 5-phosphate isomerase B [Candidatus Sumerlaeia bacterium]|nr:ribose 5-phosphate isomerase B [Candidatus Sumerlaeia bacterium]